MKPDHLVAILLCLASTGLVLMLAYLAAGVIK